MTPRLVLVLACFLAQVPEAQSVTPPLLRRELSAEVVPRLETAAAQLAHARGLKNRSIRQREDRRELSLRAVQAYRAVRLYHSDAHAIAAEAAFRAADLLRALGDQAGALAEYEVAFELGRGTEFRARARIESGHVLRRAGEGERALAEYLIAARDPDADRDQRDEAMFHAADAWRSLGEIAEARRAWRSVAEAARNPGLRIRSFDRLGFDLLDAGDVEGAAGVLSECLFGLSRVAAQRTESGERVRRALARMRLVDQLRVAIEARARRDPPASSERNS